MTFQFVIPKEAIGHTTNVYTGEELDSNTIRVHFKLEDTVTFTDYEKDSVQQKLANREWLKIDM